LEEQSQREGEDEDEDQMYIHGELTDIRATKNYTKFFK
jgi:hypothetical protein